MKFLLLSIITPFDCLFTAMNTQTVDYAVGGGLGTEGVGVSFTSPVKFKSIGKLLNQNVVHRMVEA